MKTLFNREEAIEIIRAGKVLSIAGDIDFLKSLPTGNWIGGSIPYFMSEKGGMCSKDFCQITEFPEALLHMRVYSLVIFNFIGVPKAFSLDSGFCI